jgi:hypothetical protein
MNSHNENLNRRTGLLFERDLAYPKSVPNKSKHVRTKSETNAASQSQFSICSGLMCVLF